MNMLKCGAILIVGVLYGAEKAPADVEGRWAEARRTAALADTVARYMEIRWEQGNVRTFLSLRNEYGVDVEFNPWFVAERRVHLGDLFYALQTTPNAPLSLPQMFMVDVAFKQTQLQETALAKLVLTMLGGCACALGGSDIGFLLMMATSGLIARKLNQDGYDHDAIYAVCRKYAKTELREIRQSYRGLLTSFSRTSNVKEAMHIISDALKS